MFRIGLFIATNLAIIIFAGLIINVLNLGPYLTKNGIDYLTLFIIALIFGFGGAFLSLAISKFLAKKSTGASVIVNPSNAKEQWLFDLVIEYAKVAKIKTPEIAIFQSEQPNAFATGMSKNNSLIAVSSGLLDAMSTNEVEAVVGHEIAHIANGDMVSMTLIQGVLNTFVFFLARVVASFISRNGNNSNAGYSFGYFMVVIALEILFGFFATIIVMWFSRRREFKADEGGAYLAGVENMIASLERLHTLATDRVESQLPKAIAAFGITNNKTKLTDLFASHPPLQDRIIALKTKKAINLF